MRWACVLFGLWPQGERGLAGAHTLPTSRHCEAPSEGAGPEHGRCAARPAALWTRRWDARKPSVLLLKEFRGRAQFQTCNSMQKEKKTVKERQSESDPGIQGEKDKIKTKFTLMTTILL